MEKSRSTSGKGLMSQITTVQLIMFHMKHISSGIISHIKRAPSLGRGRLACEPGIGRRRRVVRQAAFAGRLHRNVSHYNNSASASYPPCPPFQRKRVFRYSVFCHHHVSRETYLPFPLYVPPSSNAMPSPWEEGDRGTVYISLHHIYLPRRVMSLS